MSLSPCPQHVGCESDIPLTNYSSENPDPRSWFGYSTGTAPTSSFVGGGGSGPTGGGPDSNDTGGGIPGAIGTAQTGTGGDSPPLGSSWDNAVITTFAESTESQAQANDDAGNDNVSALGSTSDNGSSTGGWTVPGTQQRAPVYGNDPQICTINCPDKQPFSFTTAANTFRAFSKAKANASAMAYACKQASLELICLSAINGKVCIGEAFSQTIIAYSANPPITFTIIDGDLPDWVNAVVDVTNGLVHLTGTPPNTSDIGVTTFTIEAVDVFGNTMSRVYSINVMGITSSNPSDAVLNDAYSFQVIADGGSAPYVFNVSSGSLPTGIILDDDGSISGIPIDAGTFDFSIEFTDSTGKTCHHEVSLDVVAPAVCPSIIGGAIATTSIAAGMTNVGNRSGTEREIFLGSSLDDTVKIIDTTNDTVVGGISTGVGLATGVVYVPEVLGASNPNDCIYVTSPDGNIVVIDIDTSAVSIIGSTGDTLNNNQRPCVYASIAKKVFFGTIQGTSGIGNQPTGTLWQYPIIGGILSAARVSTSGTGEAVLSLSHYDDTNDIIWFTDGELGSNNASLTRMNASTFAIGGTIALIDLFTGPGTWCSLNNRSYIPVYPGGPFSSSPPYRLDVRTSTGGFIHALDLNSVCRKVVVDTSRNLILALCKDEIRCFDVGDNFVCDVSSATVFNGVFCPENAKTYAALLATTETIG